MSITAGQLIPWITEQFFDTAGNPLAHGKLYSYIAGTTTPLATYLTSDLDPGQVHTNPIILDAFGYAAAPIYLAATGYKFDLTDQNDVQQPNFPRDNVENVGQVFAATIGQLYGTPRVVSNNQTQAVADRLIEVNSSAVNPTIFNLLQAASWGNLLVVKNIGTNPVRVTPNGSDTLEGANTFYTIPAAAGVTQPSVILASNGTAAIVILASHKVP